MTAQSRTRYFSRPVFTPLAVLLWMLLCVGPARPAPLVTDLSDHLISITSSYTGTDLLLFGAIDLPEDQIFSPETRGDVVVVVRGPGQDMVVRRKERIAGIWVNTDAMTFGAVPGFYNVVSTRPLADLAPERVLERHQMGVDRLRLTALKPATAEAAGEPLGEYRDAVVRNLKRQGVYSERIGEITFPGNTLFRTRIHFPADVPPGNYRAEVYLIRDGRVESAQSSPIFIDKIGMGRTINNFAHRHPAFYGIIAVILALLAGWGAAAVFRNR